MNANERSSRGRFAFAAVQRGWSVFPVAAGGKRPAIPAAHPRHDPARAACRGACGRHGHGLHDATADKDVIFDWWQRCPSANVGIATGASGLVVLDLDMPKPGQEPPAGWNRPDIRDGADALEHLCRRAGHRMPIDTFTVRTGRGGLHLYFRAPLGLTIGNTSGPAGRGLGWCIDTRGVGGYVLGPGSRVAHPDGAGDYAVVNDADPAVLPYWIAERLTWPVEPTTGVALRPRNASGYGAAALRGEVSRLLSARVGYRNDSLNRSAFRLGRLVGGGLIDEDAVTDALTRAAGELGLSAAEAAATITSGLRAGTLRPTSPQGRV